MAEKMWNDLNFFALRRLFYLVTPNETTFESPYQVPNYFLDASSWFLALVTIEFIVLKLQGKHDAYRMNDTITSVCAGAMSMLTKIFARSFGLVLYTYLYENYRLFDLPWDSKWTWILCFLTQDLAYYLLHRAIHEFGIFWSFHQMHHSSEYYNLSTALRQGALQEFAGIWFECLQAVAIPPSVYLVHRYLNILYQFWIHTELIPSLGPLEYIINTPSHHRVHHGRNAYCIDRNYGGTLIIWDKMFGTFAPERKDQKIAYGLVHNVNTFDQLYCQFFVFKEIGWDKPWRWLRKESLTNRLKAYIYPPGWFPKTNDKVKRFFIWWTLEDTEKGIPKVDPTALKYNPQIPSWLTWYTFVHFIAHNQVYIPYLDKSNELSRLDFWAQFVFLVFSMQCFGAIYDKKLVCGICAKIFRFYCYVRPYAVWYELMRCGGTLTYMFATQIVMRSHGSLLFTAFMGVSALIWVYVTLLQTIFLKKHKKMKSN